MRTTALMKIACAALLLAPASASWAGEAEGHRHAIALFTGVSDGEEQDLSLGLEYEFRPVDLFGVGLIAEHTPGAHHDGATVAAGALFAHPWRGLRITAGAGTESEPHHGDEFLLRAGMAYEFHLEESLLLTPSFGVDFVDGEEILVYGISFGLAF